MRPHGWVLLTLAAYACKERAPVVDAAAPGASCTAKLDAIRAVKQGVHACSRSEECTVWIHGKYWNGCPTEVSVANAKKLDSLREEYEAAGCPVEENAACAPQRIVGCRNGTCGGS